MTPRANLTINFDIPMSCFFVIVKGKYLNLMNDVMEKVNSVTNDVGGVRPLAVFLFNDEFKESFDIDINDSLERSQSIPVMV